MGRENETETENMLECVLGREGRRIKHRWRILDGKGVTSEQILILTGCLSVHLSQGQSLAALCRL